MGRKVIAVLFGLGLPLLAATTDAPAVERAADDCQSRCYDAKSKAYQHCRSIPATDRRARQDCFRQADQALARCLARCK
jgi:hypothetical protein